MRYDDTQVYCMKEKPCVPDWIASIIGQVYESYGFLVQRNREAFNMVICSMYVLCYSATKGFFFLKAHLFVSGKEAMCRSNGLSHYQNAMYYFM